MNNKTFLAMAMAFTIGISGMAYAIPDHVELPPQAIDNAEIFKPTVIETENFTIVIQPTVMTMDDPNSNIYFGNEGIAKLTLYRDGNSIAGCSGTLIDSTHVLTAGHCVSNTSGTEAMDETKTSTATFSGVFQYDIVDYIIHPNWNYDLIEGNDLAILTLAEPVDSSVTIHDLDRVSSDDEGQVVSLIGYGIGGYGQFGGDRTNYPFGTERNGTNKLDAFGDTLYELVGYKANKDFKRGSVLHMDFDSGLSTNDGFGKFANLHDTGDADYQTRTGEESGICFGDSGGGLLNADGDVTAVNSYLWRISGSTGSSDVNGWIDCSWGEFSGHMSVSYHADWIDSVTGGSSSTPEPTDPKCNGKNTNAKKCR